MRRFMTAGIGLFLIVLPAVHAAQKERTATVISGTVRDKGGAPLDGAVIHVKGANLSDISTNAAGWFRFAVVDLKEEIPLRFSRAGYEDQAIALKPTETEAKLNIVLDKKTLEVRMTEFESGRRIRGIVSGLAPGEQRELKVVVYVLTNKWYIHPEAVATTGAGFADIDPSGRWEIGSVWRGHQASKLAILVVTRAAWAPPTIEPGEMRPEDALRSRLTPLALAVLEAPTGI